MQYVADLKPSQTEIYYLVGESAEQLRANPKLEAARARGIEVLLLTDPVDALWTSMAQDHEGKPLKSLSQGEVDFSLVPLLEEAAPAQEGAAKPGAVDDETLIAAVKEAVGEATAAGVCGPALRSLGGWRGGFQPRPYKRSHA